MLVFESRCDPPTRMLAGSALSEIQASHHSANHMVQSGMHFLLILGVLSREATELCYPTPSNSRWLSRKEQACGVQPRAPGMLFQNYFTQCAGAWIAEDDSEARKL